MNQEWAGRLRQIRRQHRLTQEALASQLEVSQALISRWESGEIIPGRANRDKLSKYLHDPRHVSSFERISLMSKLNPGLSALLFRADDQYVQTCQSLGLEQDDNAQLALSQLLSRPEAFLSLNPNLQSLAECGAFSGALVHAKLVWQCLGTNHEKTYWKGALVPILNDAEHWGVSIQFAGITREGFESWLAENDNASLASVLHDKVEGLEGRSARLSSSIDVSSLETV